MVMNSTSAVEVSIQAVSPESSVGAASSARARAGRHSPAVASAAAPRRIRVFID
jgi:hypothetical protein